MRSVSSNLFSYAGAVALFLGVFFVHTTWAGTLSCTVATTCPSGTVIYRMSDTSNAHGELASQSNYTQLVCCSGVAGLGNSCSGTYATALKLSGVTNAHTEQNTESNYAQSACISVPSGGAVSIGYQASNCTGYDTTLGSINGTTNAHAGDASAYTTKVCGTASGAAPQTLTFSISDNTIGFGNLSSSGARYATGDTAGNSSDSADAHTISIATNASSGYTLTLNGSTLTCGACGGATVTAIGAAAAASSPGSEQFGLRAAVNSGTGAVAGPYNTSNWALDTAAFPDEVASGSGDSATTVYGVRYIANISSASDSGNYTTVLTYTATATF